MNLPAWQVSQLRRRVPQPTPSGSSTMSKQWQVGQTEAQAPQPLQRRPSVAQNGSSKWSSSQSRTRSASIWTFCADALEGAGAEGGAFVAGAGGRLGEVRGVGLDEGAALVGDRLDEPAALDRHEQDVGALRRVGRHADRGAEAGLVLDAAGERDDRGRRAAAEPELVVVVPVHDLVDDLERRRVARPGAEDDARGNCVGASVISTSAPRCFHEKRSSVWGRKNSLSERRGMPGPSTSSSALPTSRYSSAPQMPLWVGGWRSSRPGMAGPPAAAGPTTAVFASTSAATSALRASRERKRVSLTG